MEMTRAELYEQVWSEPIGKVAARFNLSGNGLAKICDRLSIPRPSRSHWTRSADKREERPALPPPPVGLSEAVALGSRQPRQSPGIRRRLDTESRVRQLIEIATKIVLSEGISALNIRRLASEVGISETQVHNCVGGRADLLTLMAREELAKQEAGRKQRVSRNADRRTLIVLSTLGHLHEAAKRGPLLQILLRVPEVKAALKEEREARAQTARAPIVERLTESGRMNEAAAHAATAALTAVTVKAGGIVAGRRAPFPMVEQLCLSVVLAGAASDDELTGR